MWRSVIGVRSYAIVARWVVLAALTASCAQKEPFAPDLRPDAGAPSTPLLPWATGNSWTYRVTDHSVVSEKVTTIEALEPIGGSGPHRSAMAFKVVTLKADSTDQTISWQAAVNNKVVRYREQSFAGVDSAPELEEHWDPYKLHIDGTAQHTRTGADWQEVYVETKQHVGSEATSMQTSDHWSVEQVEATVSVPAGTFDHAIVFTKGGGPEIKTYWYVRGIGKVKETGGQTEELVSYQVAP